NSILLALASILIPTFDSLISLIYGRSQIYGTLFGCLSSARQFIQYTSPSILYYLNRVFGINFSTLISPRRLCLEPVFFLFALVPFLGLIFLTEIGLPSQYYHIQ
ncbi:MAG: hypothetical protein MHMPM18_003019, partial [Marteilia pararefringens]